MSDLRCERRREAPYSITDPYRGLLSPVPNCPCLPCRCARAEAERDEARADAATHKGAFEAAVREAERLRFALRATVHDVKAALQAAEEVVGDG